MQKSPPELPLLKNPDPRWSLGQEPFRDTGWLGVAPSLSLSHPTRASVPAQPRVQPRPHHPSILVLLHSARDPHPTPLPVPLLLQASPQLRQGQHRQHLLRHGCVVATVEPAPMGGRQDQRHREAPARTKGGPSTCTEALLPALSSAPRPLPAPPLAQVQFGPWHSSVVAWGCPAGEVAWPGPGVVPGAGHHF